MVLLVCEMCILSQHALYYVLCEIEVRFTRNDALFHQVHAARDHRCFAAIEVGHESPICSVRIIKLLESFRVVEWLEHRWASVQRLYIGLL